MPSYDGAAVHGAERRRSDPRVPRRGARERSATRHGAGGRALARGVQRARSIAHGGLRAGGRPAGRAHPGRARRSPGPRPRTPTAPSSRPTSCRSSTRGKGVTADKPVIAYCRIGERSAHTWFVLHAAAGLPERPQLRRLLDRVGQPGRRADREERLGHPGDRVGRSGEDDRGFGGPAQLRHALGLLVEVPAPESGRAVSTVSSAVLPFALTRHRPARRPSRSTAPGLATGRNSRLRSSGSGASSGRLGFCR